MEIQYLRCNTYAAMTRLKLCTPHSNNCEKLTNIVIDTVKERIKKYLDEEKFYELANNIKDKTAYKRNLLNNQINGFLNKISQMEKKIDLLYEDKINGTIGEDDFQRMYVNTLQKKEELKKSIEELEKDKEEASREIDLKKIVNNFTEMKEVNRELLVSLIDRITVTEDKKIKIYYKFSILNESNNSQKNNVVTMRTA